MGFCTTPMNLNKRANEKSEKTHRSIGDESVQKRTSLNRNSMKIRDRPNGVTRNPKKQIVELSKLMEVTRGSAPQLMVVLVMKDMMSSRGRVLVYGYMSCCTKGTPRVEATTARVMTYSSQTKCWNHQNGQRDSNRTL